MSYENHMGFIYFGSNDIRCLVCRKVLVSSDGQDFVPGRKMHKDNEEESFFGGPTFIKRKTVIVCPECQPIMENEGYYLASWWSKDGMIHGTK